MSTDPVPPRPVLSTKPTGPASPPSAPWPPDGMSPWLRLEALALSVVTSALDQLDPGERRAILAVIRDRYGDGDGS